MSVLPCSQTAGVSHMETTTPGIALKIKEAVKSKRRKKKTDRAGGQGNTSLYISTRAAGLIPFTCSPHYWIMHICSRITVTFKKKENKNKKQLPCLFPPPPLHFVPQGLVEGERTQARGFGCAGDRLEVNPSCGTLKGSDRPPPLVEEGLDGEARSGGGVKGRE